ncbi:MULTISPECIES: PAS domain-containing protein [Pseudomonas]|jgi:signal transduction histidine kinase|uniref:histidine kinase n=1 Tax=Pseudomonas putida S12 TaxID=1215087 RepID=A0AA34WT22_PSEPU|nr:MULTISPECIES: PAS domain-containing protein [Pseudomonas]AJA15655.1 chemotaxis protein CheY [Pseudomonas putida S12]AOX09643.1 hybrid sensor histidine kinase/response regulator [Pseudomonas putida JB]MCI1025697.1 PAS domain-containing protein [Pseudomonas putida]MDN4513438.1 PAS domain-containing protein [Pseudomonas sp. 2,4-D]MDW2779109.1 PAS domain-containing protein [Pseudomonas sp. BEA3.1]
MSSSDLNSLRQQVEDLQRQNTLLEQRLASNQAHDQDFYRSLFDTMDEGFCIIEFFDGPHGPLSDYVHVLANAAYAKHAGIPNVVGQKLREMVPDEADDWVARYGAVLRTGEPLHFEQELIATGHVLSVTTFRIEPAEKRQVAVLFKDVTERRRAEQALQRLNEELEQRVNAALAERRLFAELVDHSVVNVHVVDKDLRWLAVNRQARHDFHLLYGRTPEIGDYLPGLFEDGAAGQTPVLPMWQRALAGEQFIEIGTFGKPPALRHYELRFNALRDPEGEVHGAFLFAYDISERVQEQERLAKAEAALRQAQKMEAVGQLSGGIAHDFNNLLGGILGAQELMRQRLEQSRFDALAPLLELSSSAAQRASSLVHRLLAFSRQQTLQPCSTQVATLVAGMEDLLRRTIGPAITLSSRFASQLWPTFIDPPQLESALLNLCINARDAMPAGGVIEIIGDNLQLDDKQAVALELPASEFVRLSVVDNGSGMSAEVVERAVEPFFTTKPMGQGTGLGLSMTYGFVRQSGGQLRVLSVPGEGTRIELLLPRHHEQAQAPISKAPRAPLRRSSESAKRILLVEDQTALRLVIGEVLEELGYRVDAFENGPSALTHLQGGERPDLLLSDVGLPGGLNGRQLAERCRERYPDLKVLLITGYDESAALSDGQPLQGTLVLTKPFELEALAERVRELLEP